MFRANSRPLAASKRTLVMNETLGGVLAHRERPAVRILLKDAPEPSFKAVRALDDECFALSWGGPSIGSGSATEIRRFSDLSILDSFAGCAAPLHRHGRRLLTAGPLSGGYQSCVRVLDLDEKRVIAELPAATPYVLSWGGTLFGRIRRRYDFQRDPIADPALVAQFPALGALIDSGGGVLCATSLDGEVAFTIGEPELAAPYPELTGLALSPDESTLYYTGARSVGAVDLAQRRLRWVKHFGQREGEHFLSIRRLALSPDGARLAFGGMIGWKEPWIRILASDGSALTELSGSGRIDALSFHGQLLLAAGNQGYLALYDEGYHCRLFKIASSGINDLAPIAGGVLCACDRRQLRFVPLLDDEAT